MLALRCRQADVVTTVSALASLLPVINYSVIGNQGQDVIAVVNDTGDTFIASDIADIAYTDEQVIASVVDTDDKRRTSL
jgi:hypothetical protein